MTTHSSTHSFTHSGISAPNASYKLYILPILLYCSTVYSPSLFNDQRKLEKVQRYFTRRLFKRTSREPIPNYKNRLKILDLLSINDIFIRADLMVMYKLINGFTPMPSIALRFSPRVPYRLLLSRVNSNTARKFFINRVSCLWNRLPSAVRVSTFQSFRKFLLSKSFVSFLNPRA